MGAQPPLRMVPGQDPPPQSDLSHLPDFEVLYDGEHGQLCHVRSPDYATQIAQKDAAWLAEIELSQLLLDPYIVWMGPSGQRVLFRFDATRFVNDKGKQIPGEVMRRWRDTHPILGEYIKEAERWLLPEPMAAARYAARVMESRWPEAEKVILRAKNAAAVADMRAGSSGATGVTRQSGSSSLTRPPA